MKYRVLRFAVLLMTVLVPAQVKAAGLCPAQVSEKMTAITQRPAFSRSHWGILVQTLDASQTIYEQNPDRYLTPASNAKLLTTAAVLERLGDRYTIRTSVVQVPTPPGSPDRVVLRVIGQGDPSLGDEQLTQLAQQIKTRGISQIDQLIADDSYFQGDATNPAWEWEDIQAGYGAPVNSLILNENLLGLTLVPQEVGQPLQVVWDDPVSGRPWRIDNRSQTVAPTAEEFLAVGRDLGQPILRVRGQLRAGSASESVAIAIPQPARHFLQQFRQALRRQGVEVKRSSITIDPSATPGTIIASVNSATLAKLLMEANQASNNLYAESLLRTLGNQEANTDNLANRDSLAAGLEAMSKALTRLGVARAGYELVDGSGLARRDRVTARALVQTLQAMGRSPNAATFRSSLAVAGISGTLKNRFQDTPVVGKFQGKTGFLTGAAALSGYLQPPDYHPLVLSILINQFDALGKTQEAIDEVVKLLAQLKKC